MAINPAIAMSVQPMQVKDLMQSYGQLAQIQNAQNQNALAQYQLGAAQRAEDQALALGNAWSKSINPGTGQVDRNTLIGMLASSPSAAGQIPSALKLLTESETSQAALQKTQSDVKKGELENANTIRAAVGRGLVNLMGDQSDDAVNRVFGALKAQGFNADEYHKQLISMPLEQRHSAVMGHIQSDEGSRKALEFVQPKPTEIGLGGKKVLIDTNPYSPTFNQQISSFDVTVSPDAVLTANTAKARLAFDQSVEKWKRNNPEMDIKEVDGALVGVNKRTGKAAPVVGADGKPLGGGGIGKLTEDQGKAVGFGARMLASSPVIDELESKVSKAMPWATATGYTNFLATPEGRQYEQAKRNWVTANLRKESGAVIGDDEMYNESVKYFPVTGDDAATIEQKRQARKLSEQAMLAVSGPGAKHAQKMANDSIAALNKSKNQKPGATPTQNGVDTSNPLLR